MGQPNDDAPKWFTMRTLHPFEEPITRFEDIEEAKKVTVRAAPREEDARALLDPALTCHSTEPLTDTEMDIRGWNTLAALGEAARGSTLWQVAECLHYSLRLEGLTRICSHQLVRARIGVTFSETCTGDHDWRHGTFLVPRPWMRNERFLEMQLNHMLGSKQMYAADVDGVLNTNVVVDSAPGIVTWERVEETFATGSPNIARYTLHPDLKVFVHMRASLSMIAEWYKKRCCTQTQAWEMVVLAEKVKAAIIEASPWAAPAFSKPCDSGQCWYLKAFKTPLAMANYYRPDETHAKHMPDWNPSSFVHPDRTAYEMSSGPVPFATREYKGFVRVK